MTGKNENDLIYELVNKFIETVLKDRPILAFDLKDELIEFIDKNENIVPKILPFELINDESLDQEINQELTPLKVNWSFRYLKYPLSCFLS